MRRPLEDGGSTPSLLVVFEDALAKDRVLRIAAEECERPDIKHPFRGEVSQR